MRLNKTYAFLVCYCFFGLNLIAQQISVDNTLSVQQLVETTFTQECVEITNVNSSINGNVIGIGSFGVFTQDASNFPFENGMILTTGNASSAGNTLNTEVLNEGEETWGTDSDLENTLGITETENATSIEFDFTSISNSLQINYILASEEYFSNFPCQYSDGFALLIREAGSGNPYVNIAVVPGTNTTVNTTTIHDEIDGFCQEENSQFFDGYNIGDTNYNGRTTTLTASASIIPNVTYQIKLVIADQSDSNYDSAVFIEANSFSPTVDLGADITTCADSFSLNGDINNPNAQYQWFLDGSQIASASQPSYEVLQSGIYRVLITIPLGSDFCSIEDEVIVNLSNTQSTTPMSNMDVCDDPSNDGVELFDLDSKTQEAINSVAPGNYNVSYHTSLPDAQNNLSPISGNYQNATNPQHIYVRIIDVDTGCLAINQFEITVNTRPDTIPPQTLDVCDDQVVDGFTTIDLNALNNGLINGQPNLVVTYHYTQVEADAGITPIPMPYVNSGVNDQVFINIVNSQSGCNTTTTLNIAVLAPPQIENNQNYYVDACDSDYDGFASFDITDVEADILNGLTGVTVTYHTTQEDALNGNNPIPNPTNFNNTATEVQVVYISVVDSNGCPSIAPIELHTNLLLTGPDFSDITICDIDNDNSEAFDLLNVPGMILGDIPDVSITFYETENDRDNDLNAIDTSVDYSPPGIPQTLYLTLTSPTCTEVEEVILDLIPITEFPDLVQQTVCDTDQDMRTTINLSDYDGLVTQNQPGFTVSYFETHQDAEDNTNQLPTIYQNTQDSFMVFASITSTTTSCSDISSFDILVNPPPLTSSPNPIIICDDDQDGFFVVNLEDSITEITASTQDLIITFHNSLTDANSGTNSLREPENYNAETETVIARVESTLTGCISTENIAITVNTLPILPVISEFRFCENNTDNIGEFLLNSKDIEILNGQTSKEVLYFLTEADANTGTNPIDKNSNFQNTENPQIIFARVQNLTDQDCFGVGSFSLNVGTNPEFNMPTDIFECDDSSNDTFAPINLNDKAAQISNGISEDLDITFYASEEDFLAGTNPITEEVYTTVSNPQEIFASIANGSICTSNTSFIVNVIPVPTVTEISPFEDCDVDYDGSILWDLTEAEINILDIRQDNVVVSYFTSIADAENDLNTITNPENFENTSNPQTVFVKVTNTDFNCPVILPIELIVNVPPAFNDFSSTEICDNDTDTYDLNLINSIIIDDIGNSIITYFVDEQDAISNTNQISSDYNYQTNGDILFARIENSATGCFYVYPFMLVVNERPIANMPGSLESCDDNDDGQLLFDLETQTNDVLGTQNPTFLLVSYYNTESDANTNTNAILENYNATNGETIYVRVTNTETQCYSITQFDIIINPLPIVDIGTQTICPENFPLVVTAATGFSNDEYLWSTGEMTSEIEITETGVYSITVTTPNGCVASSEFDVIISEPANIEVVETVDFSDPNNITITVTGVGDYLFQLDDMEPQTSGIFENVNLGYHTLTIIDQNGCSSVTKEVLVIDAPKFMTPNNDGAFDTWHIIGVETLPGTVVYIFDRYGKLLKQLNYNSQGWDGTYNGKRMPTNDYWWSADVKQGTIEFTATGHFALRR